MSGSVATVANPVRFSDTPVNYDKAPPLLWQHTEEILSQVLSYSAAKIQALRDMGVL